MKRFECVPNFSEGRDEAKVQAIADAARTVAGVAVLDVERNADHHRSVISLAGEGDALVEGVFRMMKVATASIDLNQHHGEHPRMGATDVVPFVPLSDSTMEEAVALAVRLGERVWKELRIPVYLYAEAARREERRDLAVVRNGQFEGIRESIGTDPKRAPDIGDAALHPTAGAVAIGARPVLIAFNAYLSTPEVAVAKKVARAVRSRDGGLAEVKALGFDIKERSQAQVSMNLTDYRRTPIHRALEAVRRETARYGATVEESEIVGLVPEDALLDAAEFYLQLNKFDRGAILERKVSLAASSEAGGPPHPSRESLASFVSRIAARTPTPGGGSAAAAAGALGAALGEMVLGYSTKDSAPDPAVVGAIRQISEARTRFLDLVEADASAYEAVRAARRAWKGQPESPEVNASFVQALRHAIEVPLETARLARSSDRIMKGIRPKTKALLSSDVVTSLSLLRAALEGALANVEINLEDLRSRGQPADEIEAEVARLREDD